MIRKQTCPTIELDSRTDICGYKGFKNRYVHFIVQLVRDSRTDMYAVLSVKDSRTYIYIQLIKYFENYETWSASK